MKALSKDYSDLVDDCVNLLSERKFDLSLKDIEWRWELGELINKSEFYKKSGKGSGEAIKRLANDIGVSSSSLYDCLHFVEKYPKGVSTLVESLKPEAKILKWSDIRPLLVESPRDCKHEPEEEVLAITRQRCNLCGKILSEKKEKA